jgi:hypothetical protein
MAKLWASAAPEDERRDDAARTLRDSAGSSASSVDPEMLELVQRFEESYADLAPIAEEPTRSAPLSDELFPDFPDVFEEASPPPPRRAVPERARVVKMPRRESEAAPVSPQEPAAPLAPLPVEDAGDIDLDEALEILRASEKRGGVAPQPGVDEDELEPRGVAAPAGQSQYVDDRAEVDFGAARAAPRRDWTARAHGVRTVTIIVAAAALALGVGGGYFLARTGADDGQLGLIGSSAGGGMQLRLDIKLPRP